MAKLKLDYDFDLYVPPSTPNVADDAAVSRALAAHRKSTEYKKALPKIRRMEAKLRKQRADALASGTLAKRAHEPDLTVGPYTDKNSAAVSRAIAQSKKKSGHAKAVRRKAG